MALADIPTFAYQPKPSPWTDLRLSILKQLWTKGLTAPEIAAELFRATRHLFTRCAVIGKARRLKLESRLPSGGKKPTKTKLEQAQTRRARYARQHEPGFANQPISFRAVGITDLPVEDTALTIPFSGLTNHTCRWPIGDPCNLDTLRFCGAEPHPEKPYCVRHCRMAYQGPR